MRRRRRSRVLVPVLVALVAASAGSAASFAAALPDLVVSAVGTVPHEVVRGHTFQLASTVRNVGSAAAGASTARFYLSPDKVRGADRLLAQTRSVPKLAAGAQSAGSTGLRPALTTPEGAYFVIACADDTKKVRESHETNNCRVSATSIVVASGPTSDELIDAALGLGTITAEQALLYRVYASFGDTRLPAAFRGDDGSVVDSDALAEAGAAFDSLSAATRTALIPFLRAPAYPGTWEETATAGAPDRISPVTSAAATGVSAGRDPPLHPSPLGEDGWFFFEHPHARIWFRQDRPIDQQEAAWAYASLDAIWDAETSLMSRSPMSDAGPHAFVDPQGHDQDWGDGGSGALDIYITSILGPARALTVTYPPKCKASPSFIVVDWNAANSLLRTRAILAHEFFHVLQFTYDLAKPCPDYADLNEMTAHWAIDHVFHTDDYEHERVRLLPRTNEPLWDAAYDGWPFVLFLAHTVGTDAIRQIYQQVASLGPWEAVNAAVPGGLKEQWPKFAVKNWNRDPVTESFAAWDGLTQIPLAPSHTAYQTPLKHTSISLGTKQQAQFPVKVQVPALTRQFDIFDISSDVGMLEFRNGLAGVPGAGVQALVHLRNGTWKTPIPNEWSDRESIRFCTDKPSEDVTQLVVITTDSTFGNLQHVLQTANTKIVATADCLPDTYTGTFSGSSVVNGEMDITWTGSITYERDPTNFGCGTTFTCYQRSAGTVTWQVGTAPGAMCTYSSSPKTSDVTFGAAVVERKPGADGKQTYSVGAGPVSDMSDGTIDCGDGPSATQFFALDCCLSSPADPMPVVEDDGWLLQGSRSDSGGGSQVEESWHIVGQGSP